MKDARHKSPVLCDYIYKKNPKQTKPERQKNKQFSRVEDLRGWTVTTNGHRISFWDDENVLELVVMVAQLFKFLKPTEQYILNR